MSTTALLAFAIALLKQSITFNALFWLNLSDSEDVFHGKQQRLFINPPPLKQKKAALMNAAFWGPIKRSYLTDNEIKRGVTSFYIECDNTTGII